MTRKDYELIARLLSDSRHGSNDQTINAIARKFATELAATNPRFDKAGFLRACGVVART